MKRKYLCHSLQPKIQMECIRSYASDDSECDDKVETFSNAKIHDIGDSHLSPPSVACNAHVCLYCQREFHGDPETNLTRIFLPKLPFY